MFLNSARSVWEDSCRVQDNSDSQYAGFRDNIPYLSVLVVLQPFLRRAYERLSLSAAPVANGDFKSKATEVAAESRLQSRLSFDFCSGIIYIAALNGLSALKILLILLINFKLATSLPRKAVPAGTWVFNIAILFANELAQGYRYSALSDGLTPFFPAAADLGQFLDSYGGLNPRWEVLFKITILRMISFNLDYYWSLDRLRAGSPVEVCI